MNLRTTLLITCLAPAVFPATALAQLQFCNRTGWKADVVIAYAQKDAPGTTTNGDGGVTAQGWFVFAPGECGEVSGIDVGNHWTYYYATAEKSGGRAWKGSSMICVPPHPSGKGVHFSHQGETCPAEHRFLGFQRIAHQNAAIAGAAEDQRRRTRRCRQLQL